MTITLDVQEAQAQLDRLLRRVIEGHEIIITRAGTSYNLCSGCVRRLGAT